MAIINVTKNSFIIAERIHSIIPEKFSHFKRLKKEHRNTTSLVDLTYGKSVKSILFTDSGHMFLLAIPVNKIFEKIRRVNEQ
ncbi:hypothetical protein XO10_01575 [Marinitoga sp. 1135]|uniref:DUF370 domain-containing protein n=1 Tax=Marinitoga piezophila (strain DSM 14283 / JCM 11233 / KA3) TaxID=443254 RepID=H2J3W8_MARPK|nr:MULTISPECIES: DUF370 domain-containing protein [Marinitoga]AEX84696.1 hypothetical protein Marpi_0244 [Marinitoga piezophila KA3]APT75222.1 hypothetical protein LN42_01545 [Marinitoga sp. 1137]NUU95002.1 hypothetical protein [Marinitoga sp. 1135]NUU96958.1 hypothetical protein [Marinitoga sp. 1138]